MAIYTKHGDLGETCLINRRGVVKDHLCLQAGGDIDELSAQLGMILATLGDGKSLMLRGRVRCVQQELIQIGSIVAGGDGLKLAHGDLKGVSRSKPAPDLIRGRGMTLPPTEKVPGDLLKNAIMRLEAEIDEMEEEMPKIDSFVLAGDDGIVAAHLDVARTVCRRAERSLVALVREVDIEKNILAYLNRLSDWLFISARFMENKDAEKAE
ncbi:MAG: ATP:cob(I)alamin adenosyltransferase [Gammaproteobacteria bacterium]|nr:ATP:cob(I)alamin adenosyltransferase [Gammaproteobacteria bacterium]